MTIDEILDLLTTMAETDRRLANLIDKIMSRIEALEKKVNEK